MATSDILGLFTTPEQYQLAQQQAQEAQAIQYANLDPMARANYGTFRAGQQLGGAIGGALGGQDPQLQKITQRQQLLGMIDPANPDSYAKAIQAALQTGDQEAAFLLRNEMMKVQQQAQQQEMRGFEREKFLLDRGMGMQQRGMEAAALSVANGIDPQTGLRGKSILNEQGEVIDTQALKPLIDPTTNKFNQDVANTLISQFGQVGVNIVKQRLEGVQGVESLQEKQLVKDRVVKANELFSNLKKSDGTIDETVKAELLSFPEGRAAISEQAKLIPDLRRLGAAGGAIDNPFDLFVNDTTIPTPLRTTAKQYQSSFAKGVYDPEQADKLVERLSTATQKAVEFKQTQDRLKQNQEMLDSFRQQGLTNSQASLNLQRQQAELNNDFKRQKLERDAEIAKNKPLPANLQKGEEEDYDIAKASTNLATDANSYINRIKSGDIKFGLKDRASIATRGAFGSSDPDVIARQDYDKFIERMTSENLRLNKGVQTDKDFERELKLLKSAESAASAEQIMKNLVNINVRKVQDAKDNIERRRLNAGAGLPTISIAVPQFGARPPLSNFETTNTNPLGITGGRR